MRTIDDGFQFYEALLTLDLSDNMIETIQDGAFQSQVIFIFIVIFSCLLSLATPLNIPFFCEIFLFSISTSCPKNHLGQDRSVAGEEYAIGRILLK